MTKIDPENAGDAPAVVVIRPTTIHGPVLSWYRDLTSAHYRQELVSASRKGVLVCGTVYLHEIPAGWLEAAQEAHAALCLGLDVLHMATHVRREIVGTLAPVDHAQVAAL